jgi:hypothetical protein
MATRFLVGSLWRKFMNDLSSQPQPRKKMSDIEFLYAIAGIGSSDETDISERDEEILLAEVDPIRGWRLADSDHKIDDEVGQ